MIYLLDSNIFIEGKNRHYGFDFCPALWDWLVEQNRNGRVASVDEVAKELRAGNDELTDWAKEQGANFFTKPDDAVLDALTEVSNWAKEANYQPGAVGKFLDGADCRLVAHALTHDCIVVTHEVPDNTDQIKIPEACKSMDLHCLDPYEMLRQEGARFILGPSAKAA